MSKPVAVIRKLEDSPPRLDRRLVAAYLNTIYRVQEPLNFTFRVGHVPEPSATKWLLENKVASWAFLTAWNPGSRLLPQMENRSRNTLLYERLVSNGWPFYPALGAAEQGDWRPEESYWILDMPAAAAVELGRYFGQNALVWWEKGGVVDLWWL